MSTSYNSDQLCYSWWVCSVYMVKVLNVYENHLEICRLKISTGLCEALFVYEKRSKEPWAWKKNNLNLLKRRCYVHSNQ